jgi:hypothetical protein
MRNQEDFCARKRRRYTEKYFLDFREVFPLLQDSLQIHREYRLEQGLPRGQATSVNKPRRGR